jgi:hypothetical protein
MFIVDTDTMFYRVGFTGPPSPESACNQLRTYINTVLNRAEAIYPELEKRQVFVYGIDTGNRYRDAFATSFTYKGNRDTTRKPLYIAEMKEFLCEHYTTMAVPSHQAEADDLVSIIANAFIHQGRSWEYCIVGADKDLRQIPGKHYNFIKDKSEVIHKMYADRFFFEQLLSGDIADNIPGIYNIGPKRAEQYLSKGKSPEEWWDIVLDIYTKNFTHMDEEELTNALYERGNLLWIQRHEGQVWYPPIPENPPDKQWEIPF